MNDVGLPVRRVRYFDGLLLTAADLQADQDYFRERLRRHNLGFHGWGVVQGLGVRVEGTAVVVEPGCAIGRDGEELFVPTPLSLPLPAAGGPVYLVLRREERLVDPRPAPMASGPAEIEYARVEESVGLSFAPDQPSADGVALALLRLGRSGWVRNRRFRPRPLGR